VPVAVLTLLCALCVCGGSGCSSNQISAPALTPASAQHAARDVWHVTLHLTGGFAGVDHELELASTGELKATDRRRGSQVTAQASSSELTEIAALVADLKSVETARENTCRDCLQDELEVRLSERSLLFRINDGNLVGTPVDRLATVLTRLLNRELSR